MNWLDWINIACWESWQSKIPGLIVLGGNYISTYLVQPRIKSKSRSQSNQLVISIHYDIPSENLWRTFGTLAPPSSLYEGAWDHEVISVDSTRCISLAQDNAYSHSWTFLSLNSILAWPSLHSPPKKREVNVQKKKRESPTTKHYTPLQFPHSPHNRTNLYIKKGPKPHERQR